MKHIVVTGGSGKLGFWVIKELLEHGYQVTSADQTVPAHTLCPSVIVNLNHIDEVKRMLSNADGVIHLAAYPAPGIVEDSATYANNGNSTFNVLEAANQLKLEKVVIGSSESIYGFVYAHHSFVPQYFPIDEKHPLLPQDCYGLSKIANEEAAAMFHRRSGMQVISLRFALVVTEEEYRQLSSSNEHVEALKRNMWSYVHILDAAAVCRIGLEVEGIGAEAFNITSDSTLVGKESSELMQAYYPGVTVREPIFGQAALYSNQKAKQLLNWAPVYVFR